MRREKLNQLQNQRKDLQYPRKVGLQENETQLKGQMEREKLQLEIDSQGIDHAIFLICNSQGIFPN